MNMWDDDQDRIDAAINNIAQRMTDGAPGARFTARVLARIGSSHAPRRMFWVLAPLAVVSVVLIAAIAYRERPVDRVRTSSTTSGGAGSAELFRGSGQLATAVPDDTVTVPPERVGQEEVLRARRTDAGSMARPPVRPPLPISEVDALAPPTLQIGSIDIERLARPEPLTIERLETTSIALAPLGEGDRP